HTVGAHTQRVARFVLGADHYGGNGAIRAYYHSTLIESYHVIDGVGREQSDTYIALSLGYPQKFIRWRSYGVVRGHSCQRIVAPDHRHHCRRSRPCCRTWPWGNGGLPHHCGHTAAMPTPDSLVLSPCFDA